MPKDTNPATKPYPPPPPPQLNDGVRGRQVQQRDRQIARASAPNYPPSYGGGYFNGPPWSGVDRQSADYSMPLKNQRVNVNVPGGGGSLAQ